MLDLRRLPKKQRELISCKQDSKENQQDSNFLSRCQTDVSSIQLLWLICNWLSLAIPFISLKHIGNKNQFSGTFVTWVLIPGGKNLLESAKVKAEPGQAASSSSWRRKGNCFFLSTLNSAQHWRNCSGQGSPGEKPHIRKAVGRRFHFNLDVGRSVWARLMKATDNKIVLSTVA